MRPDLALEAARRAAKVHWQLTDLPRQIIEGQKFDFGYEPHKQRSPSLFQSKWMDLCEAGYVPVPSTTGYAEWTGKSLNSDVLQNFICWNVENNAVIFSYFVRISNNKTPYICSLSISDGNASLYDPYGHVGQTSNNLVAMIAFLMGVSIASAVLSTNARLPRQQIRRIENSAAAGDFTYRIVDIGSARGLTDRQLVASIFRGVRAHHRRGHERHLRSGKLTWVKPTEVKGSRPGYVAHDYQLAAAQTP